MSPVDGESGKLSVIIPCFFYIFILEMIKTYGFFKTEIYRPLAPSAPHFPTVFTQSVPGI